MLRKILFCSMFLLLVAGLNVIADQYEQQPSTTQKSVTSTKTGNVTLTATLVDKATLAAKKMASLNVTVKGATIAHGADAHIHYQLDNGPIIATSDTKLMFANLSPGSHTLVVTVANHQHQPLSDPQTITFNIPQ